MRVTLFFIILTCFLGLFLWITFSGALFLVGSLSLIIFLIISIGYTDTAILFFLGAREVKSSDEPVFFAASAQEAYKLAVVQPHLYFYNGALERAFVLQSGKTISLILSKDLLEICSKEELAAICFELLIQVKNHMSSKRTKVMFLVGTGSWLCHSIVELMVKVIPFNEFRQSLNWFLVYMIQPWLELVFKLTVGESYFRKLEGLLKDFPLEKSLLLKVGAKLRRPDEIYSLSSRKMIELTSSNKSRHYQNILMLEFLPHEWDLIFDPKLGGRA